MSESFFTPRTLAFLRKLKRNNRREWFHAHRDEYEAHVRGPLGRLVERLAVDFARFAPDLVAAPRTSLYRPWRDTRFSPDKSPLKTHAAAVFPHRLLGRNTGAGLYVEVNPDGGWAGGGMYAPDSFELHAVREHIATRHKEFAAIVRSRRVVRHFGGLDGERLTRVPRGFAADHPAAEYLRHKQFLLGRDLTPDEIVDPRFYRTLVTLFEAAAPLVAFLNAPVAARARETRFHEGPDERALLGLDR